MAPDNAGRPPLSCQLVLDFPGRKFAGLLAHHRNVMSDLEAPTPDDKPK